MGERDSSVSIGSSPARWVVANRNRGIGRRATIGAVLVCALLLIIVGAVPAFAGTTTRVSVDSAANQGNSSSERSAASADGRYVAFESAASNLVAGDTNGVSDVFLRDTVSGSTTRVSLGTGGVEANNWSLYPAISADGRYVAFYSWASNLVAGDNNGFWDVFVRDTLLGTTTRASLNSAGIEADLGGQEPSISGDGRYVAFASNATNLVGGDTNASYDIFVRDIVAGTTTRVSVAAGGAQALGGSTYASISGDGLHVAFRSVAANLVAGDTNGLADVFVRGLTPGGTTTRVSVGAGGGEGNGEAYSYAPSISENGQFVTFSSNASNLVLDDTNGVYDVFRRDTAPAGTTTRVSLDSLDRQANNDSFETRICADGRYVAFTSFATNLVPTDATGTYPDVFVRDMTALETTRASSSPGGTDANDWSRFPSISADGRYATFASLSSNLVTGDTNGAYDVFARDLDARTTNWRPIALDDVATVLEDSSTGTTITVLANDSDLNGDPMHVASATAPSYGVVIVNPDSTITYRPTEPNYNGPDSFTYIAFDEHGSGDIATVVVTVEAVNDAPSFTKGPDQTVARGSGAQTVIPWATGISKGPANEATQTLSFAVANTNTAIFAVQPAIDENGVLTYRPGPDAFGTAILSVLLRDNGGTANGGIDASAVQTFTITVTAQGVNHAPSFIKGADQTVLEDSGPRTVAAWATSVTAGPAIEAAQALDFIVTNSSPELFSTQPAVAPNGTLTYTPAANAFGSATVSVRLHDDGGTANGGSDTSGVQSFIINITPVNDTPSFIKGADQTVLEDSGPRTVAAWATTITAGPNEAAQALDFIVTNSSPELFSTQPAVAPNGTLTYTPAANAFGSATVSVRLHDDGGTANGGSDTSGVQSFIINITPVNDTPSFIKGADQTVLEDSGPRTVAAWATTITAGPNEAAQALDFIVTNSSPELFSTQPAVAPNGTLTYTPAANAFGSAEMTVTLHDSGGTTNGGSDTSGVLTFRITITPVNDAPSFVKGPDLRVCMDSELQTIASWATSIVNEPNQVLSFIVTNDNNPLFERQPSIAQNGTLTFMPAFHASGTALVSVSLRDDGSTATGGSNTSGIQTFVITVATASESATRLTALAPYGAVVYGSAARVSGVLEPTQCGSTATRTINLQAYSNGRWGAVPGPRPLTDAYGRWTAWVRPTANTPYRAVFSGAGALKGSTSLTTLVRVKAFLTMPTAKVKGRYLTISGSVYPAHAGKVQVEMRRRNGGTLRRSVTLTKRGTYVLRLKLPAGSYSIRVLHGDSAHVSNASSRRSVRLR